MRSLPVRWKRREPRFFGSTGPPSMSSECWGGQFKVSLNLQGWDSDGECHHSRQLSDSFLYICNDLLTEALRFLALMASSKASLGAEVLFLRKQLAFYQGRKSSAVMLESPRVRRGSQGWGVRGSFY